MNAGPQPFRGPSRRSGFTLVEVIAALTILALLTGSVYSLLRQAVQAAADLQDSDRSDLATLRFIELCRSTLETLPAEATLSLATAEETGTAAEFTISSAPEAFSVGPNPVSDSDLILSLRLVDADADSAAAESVYQVAISREEFAPLVKEGDFQVRRTSEDEFFQPDEQGRYWLPLLRGIRGLDWRFWNEDDQLWEDDWTEAPSRPSLLEMQLWPENRPAPLRVVFALPPAEVASAATEQSAPAGTEGSGTGNSAGSSDPNRPPVPGARAGEGDGRGEPSSPGGRGREGRRDRGPGRDGRPGERRDPGNRGPQGPGNGPGRQTGSGISGPSPSSPRSSGGTPSPSAPAR